jgi:hypothetical protein
MKTLAFLLLLCSPAWGQTTPDRHRVMKHGCYELWYVDTLAESASITLADLEGYLAECHGDSTFDYNDGFERERMSPGRFVEVETGWLSDVPLEKCGVWTHRVPTLEGFAQYLRRKQCGR